MARFCYFLKTTPFFPDLTYHLSNSLQPLSLFFSFTLDLSHYHYHLNLFVTADLTLVSPHLSRTSLTVSFSRQSRYRSRTGLMLVSPSSHAGLTAISPSLSQSHHLHRLDLSHSLTLTLTISSTPSFAICLH
jgi:hypothetical protein